MAIGDGGDQFLPPRVTDLSSMVQGSQNSRVHSGIENVDPRDGCWTDYFEMELKERQRTAQDHREAVYQRLV